MKASLLATMLLVSPTFASSDRCKPVLAFQQLGDVFSTQPRLRAALDQYLQKYPESQWSMIPRLVGEEDVSAKVDPDGLPFRNFQDLLKVQKSMAKVPMIDVNNDDIVFELQTTPKWIFRPANASAFQPERAARKALAASLLDRALKFDVFARTMWAKVDDRIGALSEFIEGTLYKPGRTPIDERVYQRLALFKFFVGDTDARAENLMVRQGKLIAFDADRYFVHGLVKIKPLQESNRNNEQLATRDSIFGVQLPEQYHPQDIESLRNLTPKKIGKLTEYLLSDEERRGCELRRELILIDAGMVP